MKKLTTKIGISRYRSQVPPHYWGPKPFRHKALKTAKSNFRSSTLGERRKGSPNGAVTRIGLIRRVLLVCASLFIRMFKHSLQNWTCEPERQDPHTMGLESPKHPDSDPPPVGT